MKKLISVAAAATLVSHVYASDITISAEEFATMKAQIEALTKKLESVEKTQKKTVKTTKKLKKNISKIKKSTGGDNVKFSIDYRAGYDYLSFKDNSTGITSTNSSLLTSRFYLDMKAAPSENLTFFGQFGMYGTWGGNTAASNDGSIKEWMKSSRATDTTFRLRQGYFVWRDTFGEDGMGYSFSVGRRPSTDGFLANHRENNKKPNSPLAHITNMEVDAAMLKLNVNEVLPLEGAYLKLVYGRAHNGFETVYDNGGLPYITAHQYSGEEDSDVDFFVTIFNAYDDGQHHLMAQHARIFNTKGKNASTGTIKVGAGTADLSAISYEMSGVGSEISDFLDNTTLFASVATTNYTPDSGYSILGSIDSERGYSYWLGAVIPDMITENGKLGFEFNHGSKYWTPMT
ncbi:MAG: DUF3373 family protein, partial [Sulfurimonadaceae bacterium]|nr:DUF3373 family protein [Sulfurimonadaceae bacterium]